MADPEACPQTAAGDPDAASSPAMPDQDISQNPDDTAVQAGDPAGETEEFSAHSNLPESSDKSKMASTIGDHVSHAHGLSAEEVATPAVEVVTPPSEVVSMARTRSCVALREANVQSPRNTKSLLEELQAAEGPKTADMDAEEDEVSTSGDGAVVQEASASVVVVEAAVDHVDVMSPERDACRSSSKVDLERCDDAADAHHKVKMSLPPTLEPEVGSITVTSDWPPEIIDMDAELTSASVSMDTELAVVSTDTELASSLVSMESPAVLVSMDTDPSGCLLAMDAEHTTPVIAMDAELTVEDVPGEADERISAVVAADGEALPPINAELIPTIVSLGTTQSLGATSVDAQLSHEMESSSDPSLSSFANGAIDTSPEDASVDQMTVSPPDGKSPTVVSDEICCGSTLPDVVDGGNGQPPVPSDEDAAPQCTLHVNPEKEEGELTYPSPSSPVDTEQLSLDLRPDGLSGESVSSAGTSRQPSSTADRGMGELIVEITHAHVTPREVKTVPLMKEHSREVVVEESHGIVANAGDSTLDSTIVCVETTIESRSSSCPEIRNDKHDAVGPDQREVEDLQADLDSLREENRALHEALDADRTSRERLNQKAKPLHNLVAYLRMRIEELELKLADESDDGCRVTAREMKDAGVGTPIVVRRTVAAQTDVTSGTYDIHDVTRGSETESISDLFDDSIVDECPRMSTPTESPHRYALISTRSLSPNSSIQGKVELESDGEGEERFKRRKLPSKASLMLDKILQQMTFLAKGGGAPACELNGSLNASASERLLASVMDTEPESAEKWRRLAMTPISCDPDVLSLQRSLGCATHEHEVLLSTRDQYQKETERKLRIFIEQIEAANDLLRKLEDEKEILNVKHDGDRAEMDILKDTVSSLERALAVARVENEKLTTRLQTTADDARAELTSSFETEKAGLKVNVVTLEGECATLRQECASLKESGLRLQEFAADCQRRVDDVIHEKESVEKQRDDVRHENAYLRQGIDILQALFHCPGVESLGRVVSPEPEGNTAKISQESEAEDGSGADKDPGVLTVESLSSGSVTMDTTERLQRHLEDLKKHVFGWRHLKEKADQVLIGAGELPEPSVAGSSLQVSEIPAVAMESSSPNVLPCVSRIDATGSWQYQQPPYLSHTPVASTNLRGPYQPNWTAYPLILPGANPWPVNPSNPGANLHADIMDQSQAVLNTLHEIGGEVAPSTVFHWNDVRNSIARQLISETRGHIEDSVELERADADCDQAQDLVPRERGKAVGTALIENHAPPEALHKKNPENETTQSGSEIMGPGVTDLLRSLEKQLGANVRITFASSPDPDKFVLEVRKQEPTASPSQSEVDRMLEAKPAVAGLPQRKLSTPADCDQLKDDYEELRKRRLAMIAHAYTGRSHPDESQISTEAMPGLASFDEQVSEGRTAVIDANTSARKTATNVGMVTGHPGVSTTATMGNARLPSHVSRTISEISRDSQLIKDRIIAMREQLAHAEKNRSESASTEECSPGLDAEDDDDVIDHDLIDDDDIESCDDIPERKTWNSVPAKKRWNNFGQKGAVPQLRTSSKEQVSPWQQRYGIGGEDLEYDNGHNEEGEDHVRGDDELSRGRYESPNTSSLRSDPTHQTSTVIHLNDTSSELRGSSGKHRSMHSILQDSPSRSVENTQRRTGNDWKSPLALNTYPRGKDVSYITTGAYENGLGKIDARDTVQSRDTLKTSPPTRSSVGRSVISTDSSSSSSPLSRAYDNDAVAWQRSLMDDAARRHGDRRPIYMETFAASQEGGRRGDGHPPSWPSRQEWSPKAVGQEEEKVLDHEQRRTEDTQRAMAVIREYTSSLRSRFDQEEKAKATKESSYKSSSRSPLVKAGGDLDAALGRSRNGKKPNGEIPDGERPEGSRRPTRTSDPLGRGYSKRAEDKHHGLLEGYATRPVHAQLESPSNYRPQNAQLRDIHKDLHEIKVSRPHSKDELIDPHDGMSNWTRPKSANQSLNESDTLENVDSYMGLPLRPKQQSDDPRSASDKRQTADWSERRSVPHDKDLNLSSRSVDVRSEQDNCRKGNVGGRLSDRTETKYIDGSIDGLEGRDATSRSRLRRDLERNPEQSLDNNFEGYKRRQENKTPKAAPIDCQSDTGSISDADFVVTRRGDILKRPKSRGGTPIKGNNSTLYSSTDGNSSSILERESARRSNQSGVHVTSHSLQVQPSESHYSRAGRPGETAGASYDSRPLETSTSRYCSAVTSDYTRSPLGSSPAYSPFSSAEGSSESRPDVRGNHGGRLGSSADGSYEALPTGGELPSDGFPGPDAQQVPMTSLQGKHSVSERNDQTQGTLTAEERQYADQLVARYTQQAASRPRQGETIAPSSDSHGLGTSSMNVNPAPTDQQLNISADLPDIDQIIEKYNKKWTKPQDKDKVLISSKMDVNPAHAGQITV